MKKNLHLVPINISDIAERLDSKTLSENEKVNLLLRLEEKVNLLLRLEAIRDFSASVVAKHSRGPILVQNKK